MDNNNDYYDDAEVMKYVYEVGDVILGLEVGKKKLPDHFQTPLMLLKTAHQMFVDRTTKPELTNKRDGI